MSLFHQRIKHDAIPIKGSLLGTLPKYVDTWMTKYRISLSWTNDSVARGRCLISKRFTVNLPVTLRLQHTTLSGPRPWKPPTSAQEQYLSVLLLQQGRCGRLVFVCSRHVISQQAAAVNINSPGAAAHHDQPSVTTDRKHHASVLQDI